MPIDFTMSRPKAREPTRNRARVRCGKTLRVQARFECHACPHNMPPIKSLCDQLINKCASDDPVEYVDR